MTGGAHSHSPQYHNIGIIISYLLNVLVIDQVVYSLLPSQKCLLIECLSDNAQATSHPLLFRVVDCKYEWCQVLACF